MMTSDADLQLDRLFVPLSSDPYKWFSDGRKKWELREYGGQFTEEKVYPNRFVELRKGYSSKESHWGVIDYVVIEDGYESIFESIPFYEVLPEEHSKEDAIKIIKDYINSGAQTPRITAFSVDFDIEKIELDPEYFDSVVNREKTSTIRKGHREYNIGPAILEFPDQSIPINITDLDFSNLNELSLEAAQQDGFESVPELYSALRKHYPNIKKDDPVTQIEFELASK